jgi:hypothetical protein
MAEMTINKQLTALLVIDPYSAIVTTDEIVDAISSLQRSGLGAQTVAIGHSQGDTRQRSYR